MKAILKKDLWSITSFLENKNHIFDKKKILDNLPESFIDDAIKMIVGMMNNESCLGQTLNLGTQDNETSIKELAELCYSTVGRDIQIVVNNEDVGSPSRRAPEMSLTYDLTGVESIVTLDDGIQRTYDWYRNNIFEGKSISAK